MRKLGIEAGLAWACVAEAMVVYVDHGVSPGMRNAIAFAENLGLAIDYRRLRPATELTAGWPSALAWREGVPPMTLATNEGRSTRGRRDGVRELVNGTAMARHLCFERAYLDQLLAAGVLERDSNGKFDLDDNRRQYILHLRTAEEIAQVGGRRRVSEGQG
jgi:hypothetical protein